MNESGEREYFEDIEIRGAVNGVLTDGEIGNNMIATARKPAREKRRGPSPVASVSPA